MSDPVSAPAEAVTNTAECAELPGAMFPSPADLLAHASVAVLLFMWWSLFGWWVAPVLLYLAHLFFPVLFGRWRLEERLQVRSVALCYFAYFSMPVVVAWFCLRGGYGAFTALAVYVAWFTFMDDAPTRGGRFHPAMRRRQYWRDYGAYFPMKLTRTGVLDPERSYVFGYHPHGIISVGAVCNFATEATGFGELFPGIDLRLLTLPLNFHIPFFREYLLALGINDVSRRSCDRNLTRGPGASIMIVVGGARESLETRPGRADLVLGNRKGFVKVALRNGASLVPVFSLGENDVFTVHHTDKALQWLLRLQKWMGFAMPMFHGRALTGGLLHRLFGLDVGLMPLRLPVHSVVGRPIHLEKVADPSQEQIDEAHARYVEELRRVYEEWKDAYTKDRDEVLKAYPEDRLKVLQSSKFKEAFESKYDNDSLSLVN